MFFYCWHVLSGLLGYSKHDSTVINCCFAEPHIPLTLGQFSIYFYMEIMENVRDLLSHFLQMKYIS